MTLERFQEKTVEAAVEALTREDGSRRFLIADEVGLGKTVSAKAIAAELQRRKRGSLNVVYLCPNLDIASQNLTKLSALQPDWPNPDDRLSLVMREKRARRETSFRIYSYTPDTSLPGWKSGQRTGRMAERDLIGSLLRLVAPRLWRGLRAIDREREEQRERRWFSAHLDDAPAHLGRPFEAALRELTALAGMPLDIGLQERLETWNSSVPELILRCRAALALAALRDSACRPELLILDEFHRYADLLMPGGASPLDPLGRERHLVQRTLVEALVGDGKTGPALLLLSATPYRLQRLDHGEIPGGRYGHFVQLVRFLHGTAGANEADRAERAIDAHHRALSRRDDAFAALAEVAEAKRALEELLRPIIARTERATAISGELFNRCDNAAQVEASDLITFRHLARTVARRKGALRSWVQPLWSSVPYPAETLFHYQICKALGSDLPPATIVSGRDRPAHPQLRALVDPQGRTASTLSLDALALPWLAPTRPWWRLGGRWAELKAADRLRGKALLFSRYRGTPAAVATWLSGEVERRSGPKAKGKTKAQTYLRPDAKAPWPLIALFMPWPTLSGAFEPARGDGLKLGEVRRRACHDLETWLDGAGVKVVPAGGPSRKPWRLAFDLEGLLGNSHQVTGALWQLGKLVKPRVVAPQGRAADDLARGVAGAGRLDARCAGNDRRPNAAPAPVRPAGRRRTRCPPPSSSAGDSCGSHLGQRYFATTVLGARRRKTSRRLPRGAAAGAARRRPRSHAGRARCRHTADQRREAARHPGREPRRQTRARSASHDARYTRGSRPRSGALPGRRTAERRLEN